MLLIQIIMQLPRQLLLKITGVAGDRQDRRKIMSDSIIATIVIPVLMLHRGRQMRERSLEIHFQAELGVQGSPVSPTRYHAPENVNNGCGAGSYQESLLVHVSRDSESKDLQ